MMLKYMLGARVYTQDISVHHGLHEQRACILGLHKLHSCILVRMSMRVFHVFHWCALWLAIYTSNT